MAVHEEPGTNRPREAADTTAPAAAGGGTPAEPQERTAEEMEDRWRRCMADLDNQRKRHARELQREREAERGRVAGAWLPVIDHLEMALSHARSDPSAVVAGVQAVRDQAVQVLAALGFPRHDESGVPFDPARHEVVSVVDDSDAAPGSVVQVLRPGYGDPERQLRPASVAVSRKQE